MNWDDAIVYGLFKFPQVPTDVKYFFKLIFQ